MEKFLNLKQKEISLYGSMFYDLSKYEAFFVSAHEVKSVSLLKGCIIISVIGLRHMIRNLWSIF